MKKVINGKISNNWKRKMHKRNGSKIDIEFVGKINNKKPVFSNFQDEMNALEEKELYIIENPVVKNLNESFHFDNPVVPFHFAEEIIIPEPEPVVPSENVVKIVSPFFSTINIDRPVGNTQHSFLLVTFSASITITDPVNTTINILDGKNATIRVSRASETQQATAVAQTFPYESLKAGSRFPSGIDLTKREVGKISH
jgi:hypothetical protein